MAIRQLISNASAFETRIFFVENYPMAHLNLGVTLVKQGELQNAARQFEETLRLQPQNPLAADYFAAVTREKTLTAVGSGFYVLDMIRFDCPILEQSCTGLDHLWSNQIALKTRFPLSKTFFGFMEQTLLSHAHRYVCSML
jgi:hypothetical protein